MEFNSIIKGKTVLSQFIGANGMMWDISDTNATFIVTVGSP